MAVKCVWLVQFNTPNELNVILEQIGEQFGAVNVSLADHEGRLFSKDSDSNLYLGTETDYIRITDENGNIEWGGTYRKKLTMRPTLVTSALVRSGSATTVVPSPVVVGCHACYSMPIWNDGANVYEELYFREYIAGRWDGASDITISLFCALASAETTGEDFRFQVSWEAVPADGTALTTGVTSVEAEKSITSGTQYALYRLDFPLDWDANTHDITASDHLGCRIRRVAVAEAGADEVDGEIILVDCIITYTVDKVYKAV